MTKDQFLMWIETWQSYVTERPSLDKVNFDKFFLYLAKYYGTNIDSWSKLVIPENDHQMWELYTADTNGQESLNRCVNRYCGNYKTKTLNTAVKHIWEFLKFQVEEYEKFMMKPEIRKPLSTFYNTLCRTITRQQALSSHRRQIQDARDIAIMCAALLHSENLADEKSRTIQSFRDFARMSVLLSPSLEYLVRDILDLPDYNIQRKAVAINLNDTECNSTLNTSNDTDYTAQSLNSTAKTVLDTRIMNETPQYMQSTRLDGLTPPPLNVLCQNYSRIQTIEVRDIYQDTNNVSSIKITNLKKRILKPAPLVTSPKELTSALSDSSIETTPELSYATLQPVIVLEQAETEHVPSASPTKPVASALTKTPRDKTPVQTYSKLQRLKVRQKVRQVELFKEAEVNAPKKLCRPRRLVATVDTKVSKKRAAQVELLTTRNEKRLRSNVSQL